MGLQMTYSGCFLEWCVIIPAMNYIEIGGRPVEAAGPAFGVRLATTADWETIVDIETQSFGVPVVPCVMRQVLVEGRGEVYIADRAGVPVAYQMLVFGEGLDEERIQRQIFKYHEFKYPHTTLPIMHDHHGLHGDVDWHLLGVLPGHQGKGIGRQVLRATKQAVDRRHGFDNHTALVRVNNPMSMRPVTQELGMSMVCFQGAPDQSQAHRFMSFYGSTETNFCGTSLIPSLNKVPVSAETMVWTEGHGVPEGQDFLLPMDQGEESEMTAADRSAIAMLKQVMTTGVVPTEGQHYVMRAVLTAKEAAQAGVNVDPGSRHAFMFFTKQWRDAA